MTPGTYTLAAVGITAPLTASAQAAITGLNGMQGATITARLAWGSGGTSVTADIETSFDDGVTWIAIARFAFTTASASKVLNVSGLTPVLAAYTPAAPASNTAVDGILGDRLRANITSVGTYAGSTVLDIRVAVR